MLTDILAALQGIEEKAGQREKKIISKSLVGTSQLEYTSFEQYINLETQLL